LVRIPVLLPREGPETPSDLQRQKSIQMWACTLPLVTPNVFHVASETGDKPRKILKLGSRQARREPLGSSQARPLETPRNWGLDSETQIRKDRTAGQQGGKQAPGCTTWPKICNMPERVPIRGYNPVGPDPPMLARKGTHVRARAHLRTAYSWQPSLNLGG